MSMRADFFGELQKDEMLHAVYRQIEVPPLRETELRGVVSCPAELLGARFESDRLAAAIALRAAEDSAKDAGALPLLSYFLDDMWTRMGQRGDGVLRLPEQAIDLGRVMVDRADAFLALNPKFEDQLRRILTLKLATVREDGEPNRRDAARAHVRDVFGFLPGLSDHNHDYWNKAEVGYWPFYAFEEVLAVFDRFRTEFSLLSAFEHVAGLITDGAVSRLTPPETDDRERALAAYERRPTRGTIARRGERLEPSYVSATSPSAALPRLSLPSAPAAPVRHPPLHFMGRDEALTDIETAFKSQQGRVAITALRGLRGVGKSTLAAAHAEKHRGDYRATWWIRAQAASTMRADLVGLGIRLGWVGADDKEEPAVDVVMERLRREGEGILLIFDSALGVDAVKAYLPRVGASKVLVTSNARAWRGVAAPVEIRLWPAEIGADYLIARTGRDAERAAAEGLSEVLGGLPLAHEQAAAYCERLDIS
jgi:hypothetical protein